MQSIDESKLETDLAYRFRYVADFIGFTADDASTLLSVGMFLGPMIPELVDRTYRKLLDRDCTARHFLPRQSGFDGPTPKDLSAISVTHPQIQFRKEHLVRYLTTILGRTCDEKLVTYLDMVGKIHTPAAGNHDIDVPLVQMNALMGFLSDVLLEALLEIPVDDVTRKKVVRAFTKFLWIQNDFITRHYQPAK
ncbi:MAG: protoglobin family protein [Planctomycetaceae bacterium]|nr:protoglobin family protein [Planctomycetaceae bacterium]